MRGLGLKTLLVGMKHNWLSLNPNRSPNKSAKSSSGWRSVVNGRKKQSSVQPCLIPFDGSSIGDHKEWHQGVGKE